jgi:hypothetical protein
MQDDDSLLWSFVTMKPAAEKILSDGTDVDGTVKYRRTRTESWVFITALSLEIQFKHTFNSSILYIRIVFIPV